MNRFFVLSPHLDDAIWSLGGCLKSFSKRYDVQIVNIFSTQTYIYEKIEDPSVASDVRKKEDLQATKLAGISHVWYLDLPESLLRGYSKEQMFRDSESELNDSIVNTLRDKLKEIILPTDVVLIPAGFGGHVDHIIIRNVAVNIPCIHIYYEELPYAARSTRRSVAENFLVERRELLLPAESLDKQNHSILIQIYKSQIAEHRSNQINSYINEKGFKLWI